MRLGHTLGLTSSSEKAERGGTYSWVIVNELRVAKHGGFSCTQRESVLHILLQVGVIAYRGCGYQVRKSALFQPLEAMMHSQHKMVRKSALFQQLEAMMHSQHKMASNK